MSERGILQFRPEHNVGGLYSHTMAGSFRVAALQGSQRGGEGAWSGVTLLEEPTILAGDLHDIRLVKRHRLTLSGLWVMLYRRSCQALQQARPRKSSSRLPIVLRTDNDV
jgi:hypothetical protein